MFLFCEGTRLGFGALLLLTILVITSCDSETSNPPAKLPGWVSKLDSSIAPQHDFYRFVNGKQQKHGAEIQITSVFEQLQATSDSVMLICLTEVANDPSYPPASDQRKALLFFNSGMDSAKAEALGIKPIRPALERINKLASTRELGSYLVSQWRKGDPLFLFWNVVSESGSSTKKFLLGAPSSLGLSDIKTYGAMDAPSVALRKQYLDYLITMFNLTGLDQIKARRVADRIVVMESELARAMGETNADSFHKLDRKQLTALAPDVDWATWLSETSTGQDSIGVQNLAYVKALGRVMMRYPLEDVKSLVMWQVIRRSAPWLSNQFVVAHHKFNDGGTYKEPRSVRVLRELNRYMGDALHKEYRRKQFNDSLTAPVRELVETIQLALADRVKKTDHLSDSVKAIALQRLSTLQLRIGYDIDKQSYAQLQINPSASLSFYEVLEEARAFDFNQQLTRLTEVGQDDATRMQSQKAYPFYDVSTNRLDIPAAIIRAPLFVEDNPVLNFAGLGRVLSLELAGGFIGYVPINRVNEPTNKSIRTKSVAVDPSLQDTNSDRESFALAIAWSGWRRYCKEHAVQPKVAGLTSDQQFFIHWAAWQTGERPPNGRKSKYSFIPQRVNEVLSGSDPFHEIWRTKQGDVMYRSEKERVRIW